MQINPFSVSLAIIQAFARVRELNKFIRKVENATVYWPEREKRDDPTHGPQRPLYGAGVNP